MTLHLPGADLPRIGDPLITDVVAGGLASIDPALPGASAQAAVSLGMETGAHQLLLILVDGLGYELIQEYAGHTPTLRRMRDDIRSIHTVVPSTTAAAITAFGTGERPGATNMVGFSVAYGGGVMNLLAGPHVLRAPGRRGCCFGGHLTGAFRWLRPDGGGIAWCASCACREARRPRERRVA